MKKNRITFNRLAFNNIRRKPGRSFILILFLMLFCISLFTGTVLTRGLSKGVESMSYRLGADVMAVPEGTDVHIDSVLLSGKPSSFYLPKDALEKLSKIDGIDKMSPQTYIATLNASCCAYPLQIVGIDYESDFIIKPWLTDDMSKSLENGEIIIGYRVAGEPGQYIKFFGSNYKIAGRLEQTGMGFDATVFMNMETVARLARDAEKLTGHSLSKDKSLVSAVMIKLKPGFSSTDVAEEINRKYSDQNIYGLFSKSFVNKVSSNLSIVSSYIKISIAVFWILAVIVIALLFSLSFQERKKEFAILRALGSSKTKLFKLLIMESVIIALYSGALASIISAVLLTVIIPLIKENLSIPFMIPGIGYMFKIAIISFVTGIITSMLSSLASALKIMRSEIYVCLRENE